MIKYKKENPLKSKTNWIALLSAVVSFIPGVNAWIIANPEAYAGIIAGLVALARNFTVLKD
jgi:hypothetical protein